MGRCCDGKNAYKPISKTRYLLGFLIFGVMHLQARLFMFFRHAFIKRYADYSALSQFHKAYFKDTLKEIKEQKGLTLNNKPAQPRNKYKAIALFTILLFIFFNYLFRFEGPASGYWDTYITEPALFIANSHINFVSKDGEKLYSYSLPGKLPDNLINKDADGISSKDQRLGGAIIFTPWYLLFNIFGFRFFFAISGVLIAAFAFLISQLLFKNFYINAFCAVIAALNSYILSINNLNPNILGLMIISALIYLLLEETPNGLIIGLVYGALGGIRNESILFLPAIIYKLFISSPKKGREIALFFMGSFIAIAPILYWNKYAFGNPFMHPTQFPGLGGFRPVFEHRFLFWKFDFNGMLNYPFYHKIIRSPYFSFPTFLLLPLTLISSFGIIIFSLIFTGAVNLFKRHRQLFIFLMLWFLPMYILLSAQENWSNLKMTFLLMLFSPLIIFIAAGLKDFFSEENLKAKLTGTILLSIALFIAVKALSHSDFEVDQRWYERFPRAVEGINISYIGDDLRTKKEQPAELLAQKKSLTRGNLLPKLYKGKMDFPQKFETIKREARQKDITAVDIWKYIYEK